MCKTAALALVLVFTVAFCIAGFLPMKPAEAEARTIVVPDDYASIADAVGNATNGAKILVKKGIYEEQTLIINKTLSLIGEDANNTNINLHPPLIATGGFYFTGEPIYAYANPIEIKATDAKISGFTITSEGGRIVTTGDRTQITGNIIKTGLKVERGFYLTIAQNIMGGIECYGVYCYIASNIFEMGGIDVAGSNNVICGNTVTNAGSQATSINLRANNNIVFNNTIKESYHGISIYSGRYRSTGSNNVVSSNRITNTVIGLIVTGGNNNTFYANDLKNNSYGAEVGHFETTPITNCIIYHNNFINCSQQVSKGHIYFPGALVEPFSDTGLFDNGEEGNYWDEYTGTDSNADGVGDTPYVIDAYRQDNFPLMAPYDIDSVIVELPEWANTSAIELPDFNLAEAFPATIAAFATGTIAFVAISAGLIVYFKKRNRETART